MSALRAVCFDLDGTLLRDDHVDGVVRDVAARIAERYDGIDPVALADADRPHTVVAGLRELYGMLGIDGAEAGE